MSSLKNAFVIGMVAVSSAVSAQNADPQQNFNTIPQQYIDTDKKSVVDSANTSLYSLVSDGAPWVDADLDTVAVKKNTIPTFNNPREGSLVHQIQKGGLTEWYYRYRKNAFVQVKFKMQWDKTRIVVKFYQLDTDADFGQSLPVDRLVLDGYGHILPRNPHDSDMYWQYNSFFVSTPLSYIGPDRSVLQSQPVQ